jgi:DNA-binding XRE family transcriptional regulator
MKPNSVPIPVRHVLRRLGKEMSIARRMQRISKTLMAERAMITINTHSKIEKGDPATSLSAWAQIISILGFCENFAEICDLKNDTAAQILLQSRLPKSSKQRRGNTAKFSL